MDILASDIKFKAMVSSSNNNKEELLLTCTVAHLQSVK